jgi:CBS domain containing-hemolysin-like protein
MSSGLVTLEDLLEEVFGEIRDEHEGLADIQALSERQFLVAGHVHIEDLEDRFGLTWEHTDFDTLAGLVMARLGRVPALQESLEVEGARFTVLRMEGPRVLQVMVELQR